MQFLNGAADSEESSLLLKVLVEGFEPLQATPGYCDKKHQGHQHGKTCGKREQLDRANQQLAHHRRTRGSCAAQRVIGWRLFLPTLRSPFLILR